MNVQCISLLFTSNSSAIAVDLAAWPCRAVQLCTSGQASWKSSASRDGLLLIEAVSCWQQPAVPDYGGSTEMHRVFSQADLPGDLSSGSICSSHDLAGFREPRSSSTLWIEAKAWFVSTVSRRQVRRGFCSLTSKSEQGQVRAEVWDICPSPACVSWGSLTVFVHSHTWPFILTAVLQLALSKSLGLCLSWRQSNQQVCAS